MLPGKTTPSLPPSVRLWTKNAGNRCSLHDITKYWASNDAVTFLVDLGIYHPSFNAFLTDGEEEQELCLKPVVSRKRFVVSRTALKHILRELLQKKSIADIILVRDEHGRICVKDYPFLFICLSYSGAILAITVGKRKLGCDIEIVRPFHNKKIAVSPFFSNFLLKEDKNRAGKVIHAWTIVESFAKLYDKNPYPLLANRSFFTGVTFVSYCIDHHSIFTLASCSDRFTDALVWLDSSCVKHTHVR